MSAPYEGETLKAQGQQDSLLTLLDTDHARFDHIIAAYPPGTELSINTVRDQLNTAGIPDRARGGLFSRAVKTGLLKPLTVTVAGRRQQVTEPSTGRTAHAAHVRVYTRTTKQVT